MITNDQAKRNFEAMCLAAIAGMDNTSCDKLPKYNEFHLYFADYNDEMFEIGDSECFKIYQARTIDGYILDAFDENLMNSMIEDLGDMVEISEFGDGWMVSCKGFTHTSKSKVEAFFRAAAKAGVNWL